MLRETRALVTFFIVLISISAFAQIAVIGGGGIGMAGTGWIVLIMWSPGISALAAKLACDRNLRSMGWRWGSTRLQLLAYLLPPMVGAVVYGTAWTLGPGPRTASYGGLIATELGLAEPLSLLGAIGLMSSLGFVVDCLTAVGEEIGWRGFLFPSLARRTGPRLASLTTGIVWALWHVPGVLWGGYSSGGPAGRSLVCFSIMIVSLSVIAGWIMVRTGSLWSGVILHASHNLFMQALFDPLTTPSDLSRWLTTEWGVGLAVGYGAIAVTLLMRQRSWSGHGALP